MGGGRASMKASTSKRKKTRGMKRKKSENSSFSSFPSSSKSSKSLSFEVKNKRWRKVQVDPDALLEDTDQDWGGFLELEVLEDCGDEELEREKKREEENEKADEKDVGDGNKSNDKKKKEKKKKKKGKVEQREATTGTLQVSVSTKDQGSSKKSKQRVNMKSWTPLSLDPRIVESLRGLGFSSPTPIQLSALPASLSGETDIVGAAQTGSGKTLAFGLPIIQKLLREKDKLEDKSVETGSGDDETAKPKPRSLGIRALIVSPTRELALQIKQHIDNVALKHGIHTAGIVGGLSQQKQERVLKYSPQIVVGTPGRLWELIENETELLNLKGLDFFVLDEADRMVEQGHYQELSFIIDRVPFSQNLQTFVFSATLTLTRTVLNKKSTQSNKKGKSSVAAIMKKIKFRDKVKVVDLTTSRKVATKLEESVINCSEESRMEFLYYILATRTGRTLVFCNAISAIRTLLSILGILGLPVSAIHAQQQQRQRLKALDSFKNGKKSILLATDVAARGLDIPGVKCVIQYQLPDTSDTYVHRAGRTARAESDGLNILFVVPKNAKHYLRLRYSLKMKDDLPQYPVDHSMLPLVRSRMKLAKKIDELERTEKKKNVKRDWLVRNAEAAGIIIDSGSDSEDEVARKHSESKKLQQKVRNLRLQLAELKKV